MGNRLDATIRCKKRLISRLSDIFMSVRVHHLSHDDLLRKLHVIYTCPDWGRVPEWVRSYCNGWIDAQLADIEHDTVFSYEVDGRRVTIDSPEYRAVPPIEVTQRWLHTGAFVWRAAPDRFWSVASPPHSTAIAYNHWACQHDPLYSIVVTNQPCELCDYPRSFQPPTPPRADNGRGGTCRKCPACWEQLRNDTIVKHHLQVQETEIRDHA